MGSLFHISEDENMKIVLLTIAAIAMIFGEFFILYLWFTKKYLKNKKMTLGQILRRTKKLYVLTHRIEKYYVFPDWRLYCFLEDHKQQYSPIFTDAALLGAGACLFIFVFLVCTFMIGNVVLQVFMCAMSFGTFQHLLLGREADIATTMDQYITFLTDLEMGFGDEVESLLNEKPDRKKAEANRERFLSNDLYMHKKYERYQDQVIAPEDEKWFDKKPFWLLLIAVDVIVLASYLFHESSLLFSVPAGGYKALWSQRTPGLDKPVGAFFAIQAVVMWAILNRKNPKRFGFLKRAYDRFVVSLLGPRDIRVRVSKELWPWDNEIKKMCQKLNIKGVRIEKCFNSQDIATICKDEDGVQVVLLGHYQMEAMKFFFLRQKWDTYHEAVLFMIGHELAHIHFKDPNGRKCAIDSCLILLGSLAYTIGTFCLFSVIHVLYEILFVPWLISVLLLYVFIVTPMTDNRYWAQVQELRADRVSMDALGLRAEVFLQLAAYCRKDGRTEADKSHPDMGLRCKELLQHSTWGISDYIRYSVRFMVNRILRKRSVL